MRPLPAAGYTRPMPPPLGAHTSAAGGLARALERSAELGATALQIFVKSPSQWRAKPLDESGAAQFRSTRRRLQPGPLAAHAAYLINLAAPDPEILAQSRRALADELARCQALGIEALVVHPGAHLGTGLATAVARIAASLDAVVGAAPSSTRLLLENTAGQGTVVGGALEELAAILEGAACRDALGLCLDSCHAFAAGHPIDEEAGYTAFFARCDELFGRERLALLHLNDSQGARGSHRDRHANIGHGQLGDAFFRRLLADPRLQAVPMILETPLGDDEGGHARDLAHLRALALG